MSEREAPTCRLCGEKVTVSLDWYDSRETWCVVQEGMHWLCYHIVFEHFADPDEACGDPGCPWSLIKAYEAKLRDLGHDPKEVYWEWLGI